MNLPLKYLENHLAEPWLLEGEELLESGAVENLSEVERHLWMARVAGCEVEIQISPSRVQAYTCDCPRFKKEKGCGHIAAALLALRSKLQNQKPPKPAKEKPAPVPQKLTIPGLLHHISPDELAEFVRDYARQNRAFSLALKARFTASLPLSDKRRQYQELLNAAIATVRNKHDQVNLRSGQQLLQVTRELLHQAKESLNQGALDEASLLLISILEKIGPVSRKVTGKDKRLHDELGRAFSMLDQLLLLKPAPALQQGIWNFALAESRKFIFRKTDFQLSYFSLLARMAPELGKTEELLAFFEEQQKLLETSDPNRTPLLILTHQLLGINGDTTRMQTHLLDHLDEPAFILHVVEEELAGGHWKKARFLAEKGLETSSDPKQSGKLEEHLLQLALREKDREAILHLASARFLETKETHYAAHLKAFAGNAWPELANDLLAKLEQQTWSIAKRDAIAQLLFLDQRFDELFQYISRLQSLDLLSTYGPNWPAENAAQAGQLYLEVIKSYLGNHLGRKPSQRVRELLERLHEEGPAGLAESLLAQFKNEFSGRQSLMDELEEIRI
jgi:hypothetical protein